MSPKRCSLLPCHHVNMRRKWSRSEWIDAGLGSYSYLQLMWHISTNGPQPDCCVYSIFCWVFFCLIFQPSSWKGLSTEHPAPHTAINISYTSSISLLFVSLSLSLNVFFFPLCMKAPGRSPDNARRCNDTRYSRRLGASTLAAFVAKPLGGTTSPHFEIEKKKGLAAASEGIRAKLILIQQYRHIGGFFLFFFSFTGGTNRTARVGLRVKAGLFVFKDISGKKNTSGKHRSSLKCPSLIFL